MKDQPLRSQGANVFGTRRAPPGSAPGTLVADPHALASVGEVFAYGPDADTERVFGGIEELAGLRARFPVVWVNINGLADIDLIRRFGETLDLHRLALEDVVNIHQRPKVEDYGDHTFIVTRMPATAETAARLTTEQVSMFLLDGMVLTFQERKGDCFDPVRDRIRGPKSRIRGRGADYLAYALLDAAIDAYYPLLEAFGEKVEDLENALIDGRSRRPIEEIHAAKRDLLTLRRAIWPQREMINTLTRDSSPRISEDTALHLRDCYDHTVQLLDVVETYREIAFSLVDLHLSAVSNRMNEIMKMLTIIATIFIPLGFIAGVYGMNFDREASPFNMPELGWALGYPFALGLMALIAVGLLAYFRSRGWLGNGQDST